MSELVYKTYRMNKRYYYMSVNYSYSPDVIEEDLSTSYLLDINLLYLIAKQKNDTVTMEKLEVISTNKLESTKEASLTLKSTR